jgi:porin
MNVKRRKDGIAAPWGIAVGFVLACLCAGGSCASDNPPGGSVPRGVTPAVDYIGEVFRNAAGGLKRGTSYLGNLHVRFALDGDELVHAPGLAAFVDGLWIHGTKSGDFVGDAQGVSNISASRAVTLYEAWLQYNTATSSLLGGRYDLSSEFYRLRSAGLFLNSSFGVGPEFGQSGSAGPSIFPRTSVGVRLTVKPALDMVWRTALLDGAPFDRSDGRVGAFKGGDGLLIVSEMAFLVRPSSQEPTGNPLARIGRLSNSAPYGDKLALGVWHYTASFDDLSAVDVNGMPVSRDGSSGAYVLLDRRLFPASDEAKRQVSGFVQMGIGDRRVNRFGSYVGAGFVARHLLPDRPDDALGVAVARAYNGSHYVAAQRQLGLPVTRSETTIELTYRRQINPSFAVQPDIQYVIHPNTDPTIENATVLQLRFELNF